MTAAPAAKVFSIPAGTSFVDALARGLLAEASDPLELSSTLVLLPTRRGCRALREAFLRASDGRPLLLPRMQPIGDLDDDEPADIPDLEDLPPAMPALRRQLLLTSLVLKLGAGRGGAAPTPDQAALLAGELARLLDEVHIEGLDFAALEGLVHEDYADHWKITLDFLKIVTAHWPGILAEQGWMEAALRRNRLLERKAAAWQAAPPDFQIVAAGSTGSMPATAHLLSVVARLPRGRLILPGLDRHMDEESWAQLPETHPQFGLARLLSRLDIDRDQVADWPDCPEHPRAALLSAAMSPHGLPATWRAAATRAGIEAMLDGIGRIDCPTPRQEAGAIALLMRETLEHDGARAALVTPDRGLARRVAGELRRYGIEIDDSAGRPLDSTDAGAFLLLIADSVAGGFAPYDLLAMGKHHFAAGGLADGAFRANLAKLELHVLRGPRPAAGLDGLRAVLAQASTLAETERAALLAWLDRFADQAGGFVALMEDGPVRLSDLVARHCALAEWLASGVTRTGAELLWSGDAGEAAAGFVQDLLAAADALPPMEGRHYPQLLRQLMASVTVRPSWGSHPRLAIWGPLEARLQHVDLLILGGLNEGTWPPEAGSDPWLSRPMRETFGLPAPERRIGLSAHDFVQAAAAPRVMLTRSERVEGTPTVPSRWLLKLDAALRAVVEQRPWPRGFWVDWHALLDQPADYFKPTPPAPRPPLNARPRRLSATRIETWMRDPYAIYAQYILGLKALEEIDADPTLADYGTAVHKVLEQFIKSHPKGPLPADSYERLISLGRDAFREAELRPGLAAFWWPRFCSIAKWFAGQEASRRSEIAQCFTEIKGTVTLMAPGGPFDLSATADRVDILKTGGLALIDYKTGTVPSTREVEAGFAPQLPIEAAIAAQGGFGELPKGGKVESLAFWQLKGGAEGGKEARIASDPATLGQDALDGVASLVAAFDDENTPYLARPYPEMAPRYSDYEHLARVREWSSDEEGGE